MAGHSFVAADSDAAIESLRTRPVPEAPAPDVRGLLVCVRAFEFVDPETGHPRWVRYGHDYVEPGGWLDRHYPENFKATEDVTPSDRIPHLPL